MSSRLNRHSQLSSIIEAMAKSVLNQVHKLMDDESTELRLELSRLRDENSTLMGKANSMGCELSAMRSNMCKSYCNVSVQTVCNREEGAHGSEPIIDGVFGKDWCSNLWDDRERAEHSPQPSEKVRGRFTESVATLSGQITGTDIREKDYVEDAASSFQREATEHEECMAEEPVELSIGKLAEGSPCNLSFDRDEEQVVSAGGTEEPASQLSSVIDTEEVFSTYTIPIEEEEDVDDDVQFVEESQQDLTVNAAGGPSLTDISENSSALVKDPQDDCAKSEPNRERFTCQICSRLFFNKGTLTLHMKSHKSNFCCICKQHFPRLKSHTCVAAVSDKKVGKSCQVCGKTFPSVTALKIHFAVHTGEKPHKCSWCGKSFTQKGNLKCHLRIHTGEKPFRCVICGNTFSQKGNLKHHLKTPCK